MSTEPVELRGVRVDTGARVVYCKYCGSEIWWGYTANKRRNPFDVVDGKHTAITHWSTCPERAAAQSDDGRAR